MGKEQMIRTKQQVSSVLEPFTVVITTHKWPLSKVLLAQEAAVVPELDPQSAEDSSPAGFSIGFSGCYQLVRSFDVTQWHSGDLLSSMMTEPYSTNVSLLV